MKCKNTIYLFQGGQGIFKCAKTKGHTGWHRFDYKDASVIFAVEWKSKLIEFMKSIPN
jgi:hypothetical protein